MAEGVDTAGATGCNRAGFEQRSERRSAKQPCARRVRVRRINPDRHGSEDSCDNALSCVLSLLAPV